MITYEVLAQKPRVFKSDTGLNVDEFNRLFRKFVPKRGEWVIRPSSRVTTD